MDQMKIGKFLSELRKEAGLTQEALGERIGVTNKTVSRWENGNYLPDIEMLQILAGLYNVSMTELVLGERRHDEQEEIKNDSSVIEQYKNSSFTFEERKKWLMKKWRKEHISLFVLLALLWILVVIYAFISKQYVLIAIVPVIILVEYMYQNNRMMIFVEDVLYGDTISD